MGLGFATLVSKAQQPVITVADVDGVRVAGVLLQASSWVRFRVRARVRVPVRVRGAPPG